MYDLLMCDVRYDVSRCYDSNHHMPLACPRRCDRYSNAFFVPFYDMLLCAPYETRLPACDLASLVLAYQIGRAWPQRKMWLEA
jgi:hypothetical protein